MTNASRACTTCHPDTPWPALGELVGPTQLRAVPRGGHRMDPNVMLSVGQCELAQLLSNEVLY